MKKSFIYALGASTVFLMSCGHLPEQQKTKQTNKPQWAESISGQTAQQTPTTTIYESRSLRNGDTGGGYYTQEIPNIKATDASIGSGNNEYPHPVTKAKFIDTHIKPLSVPQFLDYVFGETLLDLPFVTGPNVSKMRETIQLRTKSKMRGKDFQELVIESLKDYGLQFIPEKNGYKVVLASNLQMQTPTFISSRANQRTPDSLKPYLEFVSLDYVEASSMKAVLDQAFANQRDKISIKSNLGTGTISLSGLGEYVNSANSIIEQFDQPYFSGGQIVRYSPNYWNAKEFGTALVQSLSIEGWQATDQPTLKRPIVVYALDTSNSIFVFLKTENSEQAQSRIRYWLGELDQPLKGGDEKGFHIYQVRNTNAEILAETVNAVLSGQGSSLLSSTERKGNANKKQNVGGKLTVDIAGNRIIYVGTKSEFSELEGILDQLDTPAPEVLIEVLIAEVSLTDERSAGVEFFVDDIGNQDFSAGAGTGGLGIGTSGLNIGFLSGNVEASINAFTSNRDVKLLSKPSLVARSGGLAEIQIGQDIPVIAAQRASSNQDGIGPLDILQSIEYRKVGNLLAIEPIVFSDDRIDLTITQEVSSTVSVANSTISSPTISNRSISTQLSLEDGQTAVLGGLIQEDYIFDETGVPLLKDLPVIGNVFSSKGDSVIQTDLVLLITAYVLRGQSDRNRHVNRLKKHRVDNILNQDLDLPFVCLRDKFYSSENEYSENCQKMTSVTEQTSPVMQQSRSITQQYNPKIRP